MLSVINKTPSEIIDELEKLYGKYCFVENNLEFEPEYKKKINKILFEDKKLPKFSKKIIKVNYEDGCKVYFEDDSFVICRFSGTEPLLRIFAESSKGEDVNEYIEQFRIFLNL